MRRIRIRIAYDGTNYCGFQLQPEVPTIEGELNKALSLLTREDIHIIGASRTDSGVHALGNVAVFDTNSSIPAERFPLAAVPYLPADIRITEGREVSCDWHPRKQECIKTYEYLISCGMTENPMTRLYASFYKKEPDIEKMRRAAEYLIGEHDFTSFANPSSEIISEGKSAVRKIYSVEIKKESDEIKIRITGNGFLYNMVRIITGTLIKVGSSSLNEAHVKEVLEARDRTKAGPTAEARGLRLVEIRYTEEL